MIKENFAFAFVFTRCERTFREIYAQVTYLETMCFYVLTQTTCLRRIPVNQFLKKSFKNGD